MPQASDEELRMFAENTRRLVDLIRLLTEKLFKIKEERDELRAKLKTLQK